MKFSLFGSGVVAVALLGLVGCGGGSGDNDGTHDQNNTENNSTDSTVRQCELKDGVYLVPVASNGETTCKEGDHELTCNGTKVTYDGMITAQTVTINDKEYTCK